MLKILIICVVAGPCCCGRGEARAGIGSGWGAAPNELPLPNINLGRPAVRTDAARNPLEEIAATNRSAASTNTVLISTATIHGLSGSGSRIPGADTNPAHYGGFNAAGGDGLIGGPLLDNVTAASFVVATPKSKVELGSKDGANAAANNYFVTYAISHPDEYISQLRSFWSAYRDSDWRLEVQRIDGACPLLNPTTAQVLQWAANKWGIHPLVLYAEATIDGDWDATTLGDDGTSSGVCQVADRNTSSHPEHTWPGFDGAGAMLSRENSCFNADFFAAHLYAAFHGLTGECPGGDMGIAVQSWLVGHTSSRGNYTDLTYRAIKERSWETRFFGGQKVPY